MKIVLAQVFREGWDFNELVTTVIVPFNQKGLEQLKTNFTLEKGWDQKSMEELFLRLEDEPTRQHFYCEKGANAWGELVGYLSLQDLNLEE
jgi:hypothetical protein